MGKFLPLFLYGGCFNAYDPHKPLLSAHLATNPLKMHFTQKQVFLMSLLSRRS